jgi:hypothetical protein
MKINNFGDVQEFLSEIPHINRGGCGIASLAMFLWLKKNKELRKGVRVVYFYDGVSYDEFKSNKSYISGVSKRATSCTHAAITFDKEMYFDCKDIIDTSAYEKKMIIPFRKTEKFLLDSLKEQEDWNFMFNRAKYLPMIERVLKIEIKI